MDAAEVQRRVDSAADRLSDLFANRSADARRGAARLAVAGGGGNAALDLSAAVGILLEHPDSSDIFRVAPSAAAAATSVDDNNHELDTDSNGMGAAAADQPDRPRVLVLGEDGQVVPDGAAAPGSSGAEAAENVALVQAAIAAGDSAAASLESSAKAVKVRVTISLRRPGGGVGPARALAFWYSPAHRDQEQLDKAWGDFCGSLVRKLAQDYDADAERSVVPGDLGARVFLSVSDGGDPVEIEDLGAIAHEDQLLVELFPTGECFSEVALRRILDTAATATPEQAVDLLKRFDGDSDMALLTLLNGDPATAFASKRTSSSTQRKQLVSSGKAEQETPAQAAPKRSGKEEASDDEDEAGAGKARDLTMAGFFDQDAKEDAEDDESGSSSSSLDSEDFDETEEWFIDPMEDFIREQQSAHREMLMQQWRFQNPNDTNRTAADIQEEVDLLTAQQMAIFEDGEEKKAAAKPVEPQEETGPRGSGRRHRYRERLKAEAEARAAAEAAEKAGPKVPVVKLPTRNLTPEERRERARLVAKARKHQRKRGPLATQSIIEAPSPMVQNFLNRFETWNDDLCAPGGDNAAAEEEQQAAPARPAQRGRRLFEVRRDLLVEAQTKLPEFYSTKDELPWERIARERQEAKAEAQSRRRQMAVQAAASAALDVDPDANVASSESGFWVFDYDGAFVVESDSNALVLAPNRREECAEQQADEIAALRAYYGNARLEVSSAVPLRVSITLSPEILAESSDGPPPLPVRGSVVLTIPPMYPVAGGASLHVRLILESTLPSTEESDKEDDARALFETAVFQAARAYISDTLAPLLTELSAVGSLAASSVAQSAEDWLGTTLREAEWWRQLSQVISLDEEKAASAEREITDALRFLVEGVDFRCLPRVALLQQQQASINAVAEATGWHPTVARFVLRNGAKWDAPGLVRRIQSAKAAASGKARKQRGRRAKNQAPSGPVVPFETFLYDLLDEVNAPPTLRDLALRSNDVVELPQVDLLLKLLQQSDSSTEEPLIECPVCMDEMVLSDCVVPGCGHAHCVDCFTQYASVKVNNSGAGDAADTITCPAPDCGDVIDYALLRSVLDPKTLQRFQNFSASSYVAKASNLQWCPAPGGCPKNGVIALSHKYGASALGKSAIMVGCECGFIFCFGCGREGHWPAECAHIDWFEKQFGRQLDADGSANDMQSVSWLEKYTQDCPKCRAPTEKSGGCNHMTCQTCRYEYCWMCLSIWSGSHYTCQAVEDRSSAGGRSLLERFFKASDLSWNQLYTLHERSRIHDDPRIKKIALSKMRAYLRTVPGATLEDCQKICVAIEHIFLARHVVLQSCKFGMYCHENGLAKGNKKLKGDVSVGLQGSIDFVSSLIDVPIKKLDVRNITLATKSVRNAIRIFQSKIAPIISEAATRDRARLEREARTLREARAL
jgi:IBR domain/IBR domain, a half RING-finger domain